MIAFDNMPAPYSRVLCVFAACSMGLAGCGGGSGEDGTANAPPTISGVPATSVQVGNAYAFQPTASDPEGAMLAFSIDNKPGWASFSPATGSLTGTPDAGDIGITTGIVIRVSDGSSERSLAAFSLAVTVASSSGSLTVNWTAPTMNTDGSGLSDLAGFRVHYGTSADDLPNVVTVGAAARSHTLTSLSSGYYFVSISAYSGDGTESELSARASGTIP